MQNEVAAWIWISKFCCSVLLCTRLTMTQPRSVPESRIRIPLYKSANQKTTTRRRRSWKIILWAVVDGSICQCKPIRQWFCRCEDEISTERPLTVWRDSKRGQHGQRSESEYARWSKALSFCPEGCHWNCCHLLNTEICGELSGTISIDIEASIMAYVDATFSVRTQILTTQIALGIIVMDIFYNLFAGHCLSWVSSDCQMLTHIHEARYEQFGSNQMRSLFSFYVARIAWIRL